MRRSIALATLGALKRTAESNLPLKRIQRIVCNLYATSPFDRYIWPVVHYPRKVGSQLSFERYIWRSAYYPRRVPSQLPFERYVWRGAYYTRKVPSQLPFRRYVWHGLYYPRGVPSQLPFERYIWQGVHYARKVSLLLPFERRKEKVLVSPRSRSVRTLRLAWRLLSTQSTFATSVICLALHLEACSSPYSVKYICLHNSGIINLLHKTTSQHQVTAYKEYV